MEITDELVVVAVAFFCGAASAWMCLENRINEINAENDFILRRKENVKACWEDIEELIHSLGRLCLPLRHGPVQRADKGNANPYGR